MYWHTFNVELLETENGTLINGEFKLNKLMVIALKAKAINNSINESSDIPICLIVNTNKPIEEIKAILKDIKFGATDKHTFEVDEGVCIPNKFTDYIPESLLKKQYIEDFIAVEDMKENLIIE